MHLESEHVDMFILTCIKKKSVISQWISLPHMLLIILKYRFEAISPWPQPSNWTLPVLQRRVIEISNQRCASVQLFTSDLLETFGIIPTLKAHFISVLSAQVEGPTPGAAEASGFHARRLEWEHAESCWTYHLGDEHRPALHEGSWQPDAW